MSDDKLPVETDLTLLRARPDQKRREFQRQLCSLATMAKVEFANGVETRIAWVYNIALGGVSMKAAQPLDVGSELVINFRIPGKEIPLQPATVIFCQQEVDHSWRMGCQFVTPITPETLESFLA